MSQESFDEVEPLAPSPEKKSCEWCGAPATDYIIVQKENLKGSRYNATMAKTCAPCKRRLESRYL